MNRKQVPINVLLAAVLIGAIPLSAMAAPAPAHPVQTGVELLANPGFEGLSCPSESMPNPEAACRATHNVYIQDGILRDNIRTPLGWVTWWREDPQNGWTQPEVVIAWNDFPYLVPPRVRSGSYAMKVFGSHGAFEGGFYQVVGGLTPGATVQFSAHAHSWTCDSAAGDNGTSCGDPGAMLIYVGIEPNGVVALDPNGAVNPSSSIIWSPVQFSQDTYRFIGPVTARVGAGGTIVVFLRSIGKWATRHGNDAYWDDASLTYTTARAAPTNTPEVTATSGPSPTPGPTSTPRPVITSTPYPDGATIYTVAAGDTLSKIAEEYGVSVDQLRQLNAGTIGAGDVIEVGQVLVIAIPGVQPAGPTSEPPATLALESSTPEATLTPTATPTPVSAASICILAYHDRNGDRVRDATAEELLPGAVFTVTDASGTTAEYTSDGINEPYCFSNLAAGSYRVSMRAPIGYTPNGESEIEAVAAEAGLPLEFGVVRSASQARATATATPISTTGGGSTTAIIVGAALLIVIVGVAAFFLGRRSK